MPDENTSHTNKYKILTEDEFRKSFLDASIGPRKKGNKFFNQFIFKYALDAGNAGASLNLGLDLLNRCHSIDKDAFFRIHKGSAYYWLGKAAWLVKDNELANYFFDASVAEDIRGGHNPTNKLSPSIRYLLLRGRSTKQNARDIVRVNEARMKELIANYNSRSGRLPGMTHLTFTGLRKYFLIEALSIDKENLRSLATTFISFCMDWDLRNMLFDIKPLKGTAEPFFMHLFKGCVLFESLLKASPINPPPITCDLSDALKHYYKKLGISKGVNISSRSFNQIVENLAAADDSIQTAIRFTGKIRNTLGHNIGWIVSLEKEQYSTLFRMVSSSCLHAISCFYLPQH